jgi:hypothetical protein
MDTRSKLNELKQRKFGDDFTKGELFESFTGKVPSQLLYVNEAMRPVDRSYTLNTYEQCERVQEQLKTNIGTKHSGINFQYQGSVPLNTHTRRYSDVDILVATGRYYWVKPPLTPSNPYTGNATNDLLELRTDMVETIERVFYTVNIDDSGGKAVAISGGSLNRKMDLVPVSWLYNVNSINTTALTHRGIKLYDKKDKNFVENYPFLHLYLCEEKDSYVDGKFKKLVRYVKNVRRDSDKRINISSYDATALMYHMNNMELAVVSNDPARLSGIAENYLGRIINDLNFQRTAQVPNGTRLLFCDEGLNIGDVVKLYDEIKEINYGIVSSYLSLDTFGRSSFDQYFQKA